MRSLVRSGCLLALLVSAAAQAQSVAEAKFVARALELGYAFTPTTTGAVTGTTSGSWNGQAFNLTFKGNATNR